MAKDSKTVSTIRRRKGKQVALVLQKIKEENPKPSISEEEIAAAEAEDKCYMFDDRVFGPMTLRWLMNNNKSLFLTLLAIRCANALMIQTQYVPDEYWQSLEVSHHMVFGYGYLTWEWREGLRGYSYPLLFAVLYKVLHFLGLDSRLLLIKGPRLVQAVIAVFGDLCLYRLSSKLSGRATAQWTLLCHLLSWFTIYCCTRTLSNSAETVLVTAALSYFPWPDCPSKPKDVYKFLTLAALSVIVRPTAAVLWILLCTWHLQRVRGSPAFAGLVNAYMLVGSLSFGVSAVVDRIWYGKWTFVQLNFLWFNVVSGGANIYGVHPWHWYFVQGFPVVMGTLTFPFMVGAWRAKNTSLLWIILWFLATHSFLPHKEFRFILPAVPLACHYCGVYFQMLCSKPSVKKFRPPKDKEKKPPSDNNVDEDIIDKIDDIVKTKSDAKSSSSGAEDDADSAAEIFDDKIESFLQVSKLKPLKSRSKLAVLKKHSGDVDAAGPSLGAGVEDIPSGREGSDDLVGEGSNLAQEKEDLPQEVTQDKSPEALQDKQHEHNLHKAKLSMIALMVTNLVPALYFSLIHQRGTVMVTKFVHDAGLKQPGTDVLFLMPCHSTPFYSYIHRNISMRFLTCEPNLKGLANYTEEAELFYQDPKEWMRSEYLQPNQAMPAIVVYFDTLQKDISSFLVQGGYHQCESFFHTHFPDGRVGSSVLASCR